MVRTQAHAWHIDEREYARHEQRRGRRHAFTTLDPTRTALVVVDLVEAYVRENPYAAATLPVINRLVDAFRDTGGTIAWVTPADTVPSGTRIEFFGADIARAYSRASDEPWRDLDVRDEDLRVEKASWSAFFPGSSSLPDLLAERGIDTVVVAGTVTDICVEATVRDASVHDLRVVVVADGCAARTDAVHNASLTTIYRTFGDVRSADEVVALLAAGSRDDEHPGR